MKKGPNPNHADMFDHGEYDGKDVVPAIAPQTDNVHYLQGYLFGRFKKGFRVVPARKKKIS